MRKLLGINFLISYSGLLIGLTQFYLLALVYLGNIYLFTKKNYVENINKVILYKLFFIYLFFVLTINISLLIIINKYDYSFSQLLSRYFTQNISLFIMFVQVYIGYLFLQYIQFKYILGLFKVLIYFFLLTALYQIFAFNYGLPYIGRYTFDQTFGLRLSSLAGDPKNFAVILTIALFYFKDLVIDSTRKKQKIFYLLIMTIIFYVFFRTGSANGFLALFVLLTVNTWLKNKRFFIIFTLLIFIFSLFVINNYELFGLRDAHIKMLELIVNGDGSVYNVLDDLLLLPAMSWISNPEMLFFGFGKGLMHFFAYEFIDYANWIKGTGVYIDATIGIVAIVSDFGIIFSLYIYFYILSIYKTLYKETSSKSEKRFLNLLFYNFIIGFFVNYNTGIFFLGSIGMFIYLNQYYKINKGYK